ncbi:hypothetical protein TNCV_1747051 [Trichonephila clavipes]|nr:hypothetical protein TNCV_1747051 [Trichonephila clavipes]
MTHYSSPVTIRLRNGSISFRLAKASEMEIRFIMIFGVNWCGAQTWSFFLNPTSRKWFKNVLSSILGYATTTNMPFNSDYFCDFIDIFDDGPSSKSFLDCPVSVVPHKSLNSCRGVFSEPDLLTTTDAEILDGFSGQGVIQPDILNVKFARTFRILCAVSSARGSDTLKLPAEDN